MSLLNPVANSAGRHIDRQNLDSLLGDTAIDPVTKLALDCFSDIQLHRLGPSHYVARYGVSALAFTAALAGPIGAAGYALWRLMPQSLEGLSATALAVVAINQGSKRFFSVSPIKSLVTVSLGAIFYGAAAIGSSCARSYRKKELDVAAFIAKRYETMQESLKTTYDAIARLLLDDLAAAKDDPGAIYKLQGTAKKVKIQLPAISKRLFCLGLSTSQAREITNQLHEACQVVQAERLAMQENRPAYNVKLFAALPDDQIPHYCIPDSVLELLQEPSAYAQLNKLRPLAALIPIGLGALYVEGTNFGLKLPVAVASTAIGALGALYLYRRQQEEELQDAATRKIKREEAAAILKTTYDKIAAYLRRSKKITLNLQPIQEAVNAYTNI